MPLFVLWRFHFEIGLDLSCCLVKCVTSKHCHWGKKLGIPNSCKRRNSWNPKSQSSKFTRSFADIISNLIDSEEIWQSTFWSESLKKEKMSDFPASLNAPKAGGSGAQDQPDLLGDLITQFNIDFVKEEGQEGHQVQVCHLQIASQNHLTTKGNPFDWITEL